MRVASLGLLLIACLARPAAAEVDYVRDVKPILRQHCYSCHGALRQKSGLRLDHVSFIRQGGDNGAAIGPNSNAPNSNDSLLIKVVSGSGDMERMPLDAKPLSDQEIATLRAWVDAGAKAPEEPLPSDPRQHWSFQKPVKVILPDVKQAAWQSHPIDRFLAVEHERRGMTPAAAAERHVLLRRVYLDLIGLPPTTDQLRAFLADTSAGAYERVVDQLLASPQYGERWGRHWMDVWRYSDWDGYGAEIRESQPHVWRWRDWIIESLNADRPYDEMIVEMLAADELKPTDEQALRASGFLARNWYKFNRNVWLEATVEHTSKAFLGMTINCARCHDHMYDPILQTEYYQFRAFFEPHKVRIDRITGQSDVNKDGVAHAYDAEAAAPTYLFVRGNEAKPDKDHPLTAGVPRSFGGDELKVEPIALPATAYYPGLRDFVQQETLTQAQAPLEASETAMGQANTRLAEARKALSDFAAAKALAAKNEAAKNDAVKEDAVKAEPPAAGGTAAAPEKPAPAVTEEQLAAAVTAGEGAAALSEQELLAASAGLTAVKAKIAADRAAFANPPAANAKELAREAMRAQQVFASLETKSNVLRLEQELAAVKAGTDDKSKKRAAQTETRLAEARKTRDAAQAALGQPGENYTRFSDVFPATTTGRRAALARWIASKNNPLTARVAINHIWLRHFGSPLVPTVFDFGLNGKRPTHPELLDWLAVELMDQGWRTKSIHRLIVTSTAYRMQSASTSESNRAADPENYLLWRMNPRRMEAEAVRDSTLLVADGLDTTMFGPDLDHASGLNVPRRSIYFRSSKEKKVTFLEMFDSPNVTDCYRRSETVVPQQALAMVNSSLTLAHSRRLAARLADDTKTSGGGEPSAFVAAAFERILGRQPTDEERAQCTGFLQSQTQRLAQPQALTAFGSGGENAVKPSTDPQQRARENLVHVLLNHNDFLTIR